MSLSNGSSILSSLCHQIGVAQPAVRHMAGQLFHTGQGWQRPLIVAADQLTDVARQMLGAHLVVDALMTAFQDGPQALNAVGRHVAVHILLGPVGDERPVLYAVIALVFIRVDPRPRLNMRGHKRLQRLPIPVLNHGSLDVVRLSVLEAHDNALAGPASPAVELLGLVLVLLQPAHERLIHFDRADKRHVLLPPHLPNPMLQMPRRFLRDAEQLAELDTGEPFRVDGEQVEGQRPRLVAEIRAVHDRVGTHGEVFAAGAATVRLRVGRSWMLSESQAGQRTPSGQRRSMNHASAVASSGNLRSNSTKLSSVSMSQA